MPLNTIIIFVVENGQTCFVIKLLITLNSKPTCVLHVFEFSSLDSSMIIWLWFLSLSSSAPESETTWNVGGRNSFVTFKIYTVGFIKKTQQFKNPSQRGMVILWLLLRETTPKSIGPSIASYILVLRIHTLLLVLIRVVG